MWLQKTLHTKEVERQVIGAHLHISSRSYRKVRVAELVKWHQSKSQERDATIPGRYVPQEGTRH